MFIGHYGLGYIVKKKVEQVPLWLLFTSVQLLDLLAFTFVLLGIEGASYTPNQNPFLRNHLVLPYSHSLTGAFIISTAVYFIFVKRNKKQWALVLAACVLSHWFIDFIVHLDDLSLFFGYGNIGLGLWKYPTVAFTLELAFLIFGWLLLRKLNLPSILLLILMTASFSSMLFSEEPAAVQNSDVLRTLIVLVSNGIFILLAFFSERNRRQLPSTV